MLVFVFIFLQAPNSVNMEPDFTIKPTGTHAFVLLIEVLLAQ